LVEKLKQEEVVDLKLESTIKRNIVLFFAGALVSNFGTYMYNFAVGLYVLSVTGSGQTFSISILFGLVPRIILSPFAGVLADRVDRKKMTVVMDLLSGLLLIGVFTLTRFTALSLGIIYFSTAMLTILNTFFGVSISAGVPNLVDQKRLIKINSIRSMINSSSAIAGPLLGGLVYAIIGIEYFILVNGISFFLSGLSEMFMDFNIHNHTIDERVKRESFATNFKEGIRYLSKHKTIIRLLRYILFINFMTASITIVLPYTSIEVLKTTPTQHGFIQMGLPLGLLIMSLLYTLFNKSQDKIFRKVTLNMFALGLLILTLGLPTNPILEGFTGESQMILLFVISLGLGLVMTAINIPLQTMLQLTIDDAFRGRVGGVLGTIAGAIMPLGILFFGFMVDRIDSYIIPIFSGILLLVISLFMTRDYELKKM
jgi:MFS family permease